MPVAPSPAVSRACDVLALLAEEAEQSLRLADIARRLDMPRATCQTILLALCERGFAVRHDPAVAYTLGPACVRVGEAAGRSLPVVALAAEAVATLARLTGFASGSVLRAGDTVQVADAALGIDPFGPRVALGQGVSFVAPFGAVFAAWSDDRIRDAWLDRCDPPLDERERARYLDALAATRAREWVLSVRPEQRPDLTEVIMGVRGDVTRAHDHATRALAHTEYLASTLAPGTKHRVSQLSAPVFNHAGHVVLGLMLIGPAYDLSTEEIDAVGALLRDTARDVTKALGGVLPDDEELR